MKLGIENISTRQVAIKVESGTGPATVHGFSKTECLAFIDNYEDLVIDGHDGNGAQAQKASWTSR